MKIRHKQSGVVLEGQFCKLDNSYGRSWYQGHGVRGTSDEYCTSEWEAVPPEPVWKDVTEDCDSAVNLSGDLLICLKEHCSPTRYDVPLKRDRYRLRKVRADSLHPADHAFIIEQRQP